MMLSLEERELRREMKKIDEEKLGLRQPREYEPMSRAEIEKRRQKNKAARAARKRNR